MNLLFGVRYKKLLSSLMWKNLYKKQARNIDIDVYICYNVEYKG